MRRRIVAVAMTLVFAGCGGSALGPSLKGKSWAAVLREARGQTVNIWMYSGDGAINKFIDNNLAKALAPAGVKIHRVPITDYEAVDRATAEKRAGKTTGGAVDLYWSNGPEFAKGKTLGLWQRNWVAALPNYQRYVDPSSGLVTSDFGNSVDGQESPWLSAAFQFVYDSAKLKAAPQTFEALLSYARAHPGRVTYPAPPDFTGDAFVRQVVQHFGGDQNRAFAYLKTLKRFTYKEGKVYPKDEAEIADLFGNGQLDFAMSYGPNYVFNNVQTGKFPKSARPFLLDGHALVNYSYMALTYDAAHAAGAEVLANALLSPEVQAEIANPEIVGDPPVIDTSRLNVVQRRLFAFPTRATYRVGSLGNPPLAELPVSVVVPLESRWKREILK